MLDSALKIGTLQYAGHVAIMKDALTRLLKPQNLKDLEDAVYDTLDRLSNIPDSDTLYMIDELMFYTFGYLPSSLIINRTQTDKYKMPRASNTAVQTNHDSLKEKINNARLRFAYNNNIETYMNNNVENRSPPTPSQPSTESNQPPSPQRHLKPKTSIFTNDTLVPVIQTQLNIDEARKKIISDRVSKMRTMPLRSGRRPNVNDNPPLPGSQPVMTGGHRRNHKHKSNKTKKSRKDKTSKTSKKTRRH